MTCLPATKNAMQEDLLCPSRLSVHAKLYRVAALATLFDQKLDDDRADNSDDKQNNHQLNDGDALHVIHCHDYLH